MKIHNVKPIGICLHLDKSYLVYCDLNNNVVRVEEVNQENNQVRNSYLENNFELNLTCFNLKTCWDVLRMTNYYNFSCYLFTDTKGQTSLKKNGEPPKLITSLLSIPIGICLRTDCLYDIWNDCMCYDVQSVVEHDKNVHDTTEPQPGSQVSRDLNWWEVFGLDDFSLYSFTDRNGQTTIRRSLKSVSYEISFIHGFVEQN